MVSCAELVKFTEVEIKEHLQEQEAADIRRATRSGGEGNEWIPTPTLILTINGTVIRENVDFGWIRCRMRRPDGPLWILRLRAYPSLVPTTDTNVR